MDQKTRHPLKRGTSSSQQRKKQRRVADPAVQLRAAAHAAAQVAAESDAEEADLQTLRSEKPDSWSSLVPSPEKEAIREELVNESGSDGFCEEAEKPSLKERFKDSIPEFEEIQEIEAIMGETNQSC